MRFVRNDNNIISKRIGLTRAHIFIELLNKRKDMAFMLSKKRLQMRTACGPTFILVVINNTAPRECLIYLGIKFVAIRQNQKCKVAAEFAMDLARKVNHRITLA